MNNSFVFYRSFKDTVDKIPDKEIKLKLYNAIVSYGLDGTYDDSDEIIDAFMQNIIVNVNKAQQRYNNSVENGKKGGRPEKYDHNYIQQLIAAGKTNKEIAKIVGCTEKTVYRDRKKLGG